MLLVVHRHGGVLHEGIVAVRPGTVEVPVHFVAGTVREATVDVSVVELETVQDVDVVVEIFAVHNQDVFFVRHVETPVLVAVIMDVAQIRTQTVGAFRVFVVDVETLQTVVLNLIGGNQSAWKILFYRKGSATEILTLLVGLLDRSSFESGCSISLLLDGIDVVDGLGSLKLVKIACGESIKLWLPNGDCFETFRTKLSRIFARILT